jgi:hypothetical protein
MELLCSRVINMRVAMHASFFGCKVLMHCKLPVNASAVNREWTQINANPLNDRQGRIGSLSAARQESNVPALMSLRLRARDLSHKVGHVWPAWR